MPNGDFDGSEAEWERLEAPLRKVDWVLQFFALRHLLPLSRNGRGGHEWPERSFRWGTPVSRLIQLYLKDREALTYNLWVCASENRGGARYWKQSMLKEGIRGEDIRADLPAVLRVALKTVRAWQSSDLEIARVGPP